MTVVAKTDLNGTLPLVARGKVRDIYEVSSDTLLFVATDRISAYDIILNNPIPDKGVLLTKLSIFWFKYLKDIIPSHLLSSDLSKYLPAQVYDNYKNQLDERSLLVKKFKIIPLECIVRGYITGSAWQEYQSHGTIHGQTALPGLIECSKLPKVLFTPSTKAAQGQHDLNISIEEARKIVNNDVLFDKILNASIKLYETAAQYAETRGIIIADTKFEFGIDDNDNLILVDEVLTPDSSRFWSKKDYEVGKDQDSFDKQFLRNWLIQNDLKGVEDVSIPNIIVEKTREKYIEVYEFLTGESF